MDRCCLLATTLETTLAPAIWDCKANIVCVCVCVCVLSALKSEARDG